MPMRSALSLVLGLAVISPLPAGQPPAGDAPQGVANAPPVDAETARVLREILDSGQRRAATPAVPRSDATSGGRDSRIDYALGVVLLRQLKHREAAAAFEQAAAAAQPFYLPAWQALIRTHLVLNDADTALRHAEHLAARLAALHEPQPDGGLQRSGAAWLGRVAGYLGLDGVELLERRALLTAHEARVRLALGEPLLPAWQEGRESLRREYQKLLQQRAAARTEIAARAEQRQEAEAAEIEARKSELDQQAEALQMTAREWRAWLDDVLRQTDKKLEILQKDYTFLDVAAREVTGEILSRHCKVTALRLLGDELRPALQPGSVDPRVRNTPAQQRELTLIGLENQIAQLQIQFNTLAARAATVATQARALLAERTAAARRFEQASGQLAKQDATLQKWEKLLEKSAAKAEPQTVTDTKQYRSLTNRLTQVATYFELDVDRERQRLLAEISPAEAAGGTTETGGRNSGVSP